MPVDRLLRRFDAVQLQRFDVVRAMLLVATLLTGLAGTAVGDEPGPTLLDRHRIDPAGIPGSLILTGSDVPTTALQMLLQLGQRDRIVVLRGERGGKSSIQQTARLLEQAEALQVRSFEVVRAGKESTRATEALARATAIWIAVEDDEEAVTILSEPVRTELRAAAERGTPIGASGQAATELAAYQPVRGEDAANEDGEPIRSSTAGLGLLPGVILSLDSGGEATNSPLDDFVQRLPGTFGFELGEDAALVVRGRRINVLGDGSVRVVLPKCDWREQHEVVLRGPRAVADLTALRLSAIDRFLPPFPPKEPPVPRLGTGTLIIIGGGGMPKGIIERFVELAGGEDAKIVVLPTAMPDPISTRGGIAKSFREAGAGQVTVLPGRTRAVVDGQASLDALREATGLWFGGGRQWRFADAYLGTEALGLMHDVLKRDGVVMGSSAGASIQAGYLARANPLGNRDIMAEGYERGLGFLPGVAVDQHFAQRRRFDDMTSLVDRHPQLLGIGIDESTAVIVHGQTAEVVGRFEAHFYDRSQPVPEGKPDHLSLKAGAMYDLVERKLLESGTNEDPPPAEP